MKRGNSETSVGALLGGGNSQRTAPGTLASGSGAEPSGRRREGWRSAIKPMLPVRGAVALLDKDEDGVVALLEDGSLPWAWNIALNPVTGQKKELRILSACVASYMRGQECRLTWRDVERMLVPPAGAVLLGREGQRLLNCSGTHLYTLAARKALKLLSKPKCARNGSARIELASWAEFLRARRWP